MSNKYNTKYDKGNNEYWNHTQKHEYVRVYVKLANELLRGASSLDESYASVLKRWGVRYMSAKVF